ncbi:hypothetical protein ABW20_dc0106812 [Dactylellina cionopaga]|nr:hypothetical protein ABW20_dc0106812 [Dactylellina cionopaga]
MPVASVTEFVALTVTPPETHFVQKYASSAVRSWPARVENELTWKGSDLSPSQYAYILSEDEITEIENALAHFNDLGIFGDQIGQETFPLPNLGPKLRGIAAEVHSGIGFTSIQGLDPEKYSDEENILMFLGVSSYIGKQTGVQGLEGNIFTHIMNSPIPNSVEPQCTRPMMFSKKEATFHADHDCDILALHFRRLAISGGRQMVASSSWIYNQIAATRPDLLEELVAPQWPMIELSREDANSIVNRPLLYYQDGKIILNFLRRALTGIEGAYRLKGLADITPKQLEALDMLQSLAEEGQVMLECPAGSMNFVNNYAILHSREAFEDNQSNHRYVVRMFIRDPELQWQLPAQFKSGRDFLYGCPKEEQQWNIARGPKMTFNVTERLHY